MHELYQRSDGFPEVYIPHKKLIYQKQTAGGKD